MTWFGRLSFFRSSALIFAAITLLLFSDVLFSNSIVLSQPGLDITAYFLQIREYGFSEFAHGRIPFWNPHSFSGTPFAANVQTGLFYPPNWIYLVFPTVLATNLVIAVHFFLAAWFTGLWSYSRNGSKTAAIFAGLIFSCSGGYFLHLHAGHLTILCAAAWTPLLFLCLDHYLGHNDSDPSSRAVGIQWNRWALAIGALSVAMPILAGHPQIAYYSYLSGGLYFLVNLSLSPKRVQAALLAGGAIAIGILLSAIQFLPSYALTTITTRSTGMSQQGALAFALPPENLLTLFLPHFFGSAGANDYIGRWFLWETSLFVGGVAFLFAVYSFTIGTRQRRIFYLIIALILLAGIFSSIHDLFLHLIPGFGSFRATGRFGLIIDLFLAILAADGLSNLLGGRAPPRWIIGSAAGLAVASAVTIPLLDEPDAWRDIVQSLQSTGQCLIPGNIQTSPRILGYTLHTATTQLAVAATIFGIAAVCLLLWRWKPTRASKPCIGVLLLLAAAELLGTAYKDRTSGPPNAPFPKAWANAIPFQSDFRVFLVDPLYANESIRSGYLDAGGYDPTVIGRYARFLAISQGQNPAQTDAAPPIDRPSPLLRALRATHVLYGTPANPEVGTLPNPLPHFQWLHRYQTCKDINEVYAALASDSFDPSQIVILESNPTPPPDPSGQDGTLRILAESPESIEIEATTSAPSLLLMTDAYAAGWKITAIGASNPQPDYSILPADLALRAIPLSAGKHHLRLTYTPPLFAAGAGVSLLTLAALTTTLLVCGRLKARRP